MSDDAEPIRDLWTAKERAKLAEQDRDQLARLEKALAERQAKVKAAQNQLAANSAEVYRFPHEKYPYEGCLGSVTSHKIDSRTAKLNYLRGVLEVVCNLHNPHQELANLREKLLAQVLIYFEEEK